MGIAPQTYVWQVNNCHIATKTVQHFRPTTHQMQTTCPFVYFRTLVCIRQIVTIEHHDRHFRVFHKTFVGTSIPSVLFERVKTRPSSGTCPSGKGIPPPGSYATIPLIFFVFNNVCQPTGPPCECVTNTAGPILSNNARTHRNIHQNLQSQALASSV